MSHANDKRIARNTAFLYVRMLLIMVVSLYTSRVVLQTLGVSNYGIYNVVGGIVTIFAFLNGTMAGATQRFLNFEMGRCNYEKLRHTFSAALSIHLAIAAFVVIVGETVGLWFVNTQLVVAPERMFAANCTYQLSLFSCVFTIIQVPFMADIMANEKMDAYAYLSLLSSFLKLGIALLLIFVATADTLIVYAVLMLLVNVVVFCCYFVYSLRKFDECTLQLRAPREVLRGLIGFSGADIVGNLCCTMNYQGTLVVLNRFGGTVLNAAGGITMQVSGAMSQFGMSIVSAFRPQIVKQYAAGDFDYMNKLMANCSRFSLLLMAIFAAPAIVEMDSLLQLWLGQAPDYAAIFCRVAVITAFTEMIRLALNCGVHATGRIFWFSLITGGLYLVEMPLMYWLIFATKRPWIVYLSHFVFGCVLLAVTLIILKKLMPQFRCLRFMWRGIFVPAVIIILAIVAANLVSDYFEPSFGRLILSGIASAIVLIALGFTCGIDSATRKEILSKIKSKF